MFQFVLIAEKKNSFINTKTWLKGKSDTYLTQVCKLLQSIENLERIHKKPELSANIVAFISCRSRLTLMLAGAPGGAVERREVVIGETGEINGC